MWLGGGLQSSDEQIQTVLVLSQQGGGHLVVLPQDEPGEQGLGAQRRGGVGAALLQEPVEGGEQGGQDGLVGGENGQTESGSFTQLLSDVCSPAR